MRCITTRAARSSWRATVTIATSTALWASSWRGRRGRRRSAARRDRRPGVVTRQALAAAMAPGSRAMARHSRSRRRDRTFVSAGMPHGAGGGSPRPSPPRPPPSKPAAARPVNGHRPPHRRGGATHSPWSRARRRAPADSRSLSASSEHPWGHGARARPHPRAGRTLRQRGSPSPRARPTIGSASSPTRSASALPPTSRSTDDRSRGTRRSAVRGSAAAATSGPPARPGPRRNPSSSPRATPDRQPASSSTSAPGRHVVGRSPRAAVRIVDPLLEAHHGVLDVAADGTVSFLQLTGRVPCRIDGLPVAGPTVVPDGGIVTLGASRIRFAAAGARRRSCGARRRDAGGDRRRPVAAGPAAQPADGAPVAARADRGAGRGRRAAAAGRHGHRRRRPGRGRSHRHRPRHGLGAVPRVRRAGLFASAGVWVVRRWAPARAARLPRRVAGGRRGVRRGGRARSDSPGLALPRRDDARRGGRGRGGAARCAAICGAAAAVIRTSTGCRSGAARSSWTSSSTRAGPSRSHRSWRPSRRPRARLDDVTVPVVLGPGAALALAGPHAVAVARSLVVQLVVWSGPADVQLVVVAGDPAAWDWCRWLPHAAGPDGPRVVAADDADRLAAVLGAPRRRRRPPRRRRHRPCRRAEPADRPAAPVPRAARRARRCSPSSDPMDRRRRCVAASSRSGRSASGRWWPDASADGHPVPVHVAGVTDATATAVGSRRWPGSSTRRIRCRRAGRRSPSRSGGWPSSTGRRRSTTRSPSPPAGAAAGDDPAPIAALGATADGVVAIDLARDGPHALVAGTTGSGKSELLRTLVVGLAARCSPDHVTFVLVDYKGGSTFDACADLPHTVGLVTDLDDELAARALASLDAEVRRREHVLRGSGAVDLTDHRARGGAPLPRLVVVIDEFATLAAELPDFLGALVGVAQRGRSLGIHLVLATQRPAGVVSDDIRANTNLRIALRLQDVADARDVVGHDAPVSFPRGAPGRAMLRLGADEHIVFQAARSSGPAALGRRRPPARRRRTRDPDGGGESELAVLVRTIRNAAALSDVARPHRPWLPPLPASLSAADVAACAGADGAAGSSTTRPTSAAGRCGGRPPTATWRSSAPRIGHDDGAGRGGDGGRWRTRTPSRVPRLRRRRAWRSPPRRARRGRPLRGRAPAPRARAPVPVAAPAGGRARGPPCRADVGEPARHRARRRRHARGAHRARRPARSRRPRSARPARRRRARRSGSSRSSPPSGRRHCRPRSWRRARRAGSGASTTRPRRRCAVSRRVPCPGGGPGRFVVAALRPAGPGRPRPRRRHRGGRAAVARRRSVRCRRR